VITLSGFNCTTETVPRDVRLDAHKRGGEGHLMYPKKQLSNSLVIKMQKNKTPSKEFTKKTQGPLLPISP
jgi:hypothetical protein